MISFLKIIQDSYDFATKAQNHERKHILVLPCFCGLILFSYHSSEKKNKLTKN